MDTKIGEQRNFVAWFRLYRPKPYGLWQEESRGVSTDLVIAKLDVARVALLEARTAQEAHSIVAIAAAAGTYARQQQLGEAAIGYAHEIKILALCRLGEILDESDKNKGGHARSMWERASTTPRTLADLGISRKISMLAQWLARMTPEQVGAIARRLRRHRLPRVPILDLAAVP